MSRKTQPAFVPDASQRRRPVRVRSRRITASFAKLYPPDGEGKIWWGRLKKALGTGSSDFVNASLHQLQAAAQFPGIGISETGINAALAMIEGFAPQNEVEAALAVQMACTHIATMSVLARLGPGGGPEDRAVRLASAAARLARAFTNQFEAIAAYASCAEGNLPGHKHAGAIDSVQLAATASRVCTKVYVRKTISDSRPVRRHD